MPPLAPVITTIKFFKERTLFALPNKYQKKPPLIPIGWKPASLSRSRSPARYLNLRGYIFPADDIT
jgi:hypothetical protein